MRAYSQLADLEILLNSIPDENIRAYAGEAIASYSAGAYRSAIVSIWISVVYDLYQKTRYLAEQFQDKAAQKCLEEIEKIRSHKDKKQISSWERSLLDKAYDDLKMLSSAEYDHLQRIQQDRHRCAHPVLDADGFLFQPLPELARSHIRTAVEVLLSQPPIIGKVAIETFRNDVEGKFFPNKLESVRSFLNGRHLPMSEKYRINLIIYSMKKALHLEPDEWNITRRYIFAFYSLTNDFNEDFRKIDKNAIAKIVGNTKDDRYHALASLLYAENSLFDSIPSFIIEKFREYLFSEANETIKLYVINLFPDLKEKMLEDYLSRSTSVSSISYICRFSSTLSRLDALSLRQPDFVQEIIRININQFLNSSSVIKAEALGEDAIVKLAKHWSIDDVTLFISSHFELPEERLNILLENPDVYENLFLDTINKFPESLEEWKKLSKFNEKYPQLANLDLMTREYPNHDKLSAKKYLVSDPI
jgi:hypothetical protein